MSSNIPSTETLLLNNIINAGNAVNNYIHLLINS